MGPQNEGNSIQLRPERVIEPPFLVQPSAKRGFADASDLDLTEDIWSLSLWGGLCWLCSSTGIRCFEDCQDFRYTLLKTQDP